MEKQIDKATQVTVQTAGKISDITGFKPEEIAVIKATVAKNTTDTELAYFLSIAHQVQLNPFIKEIWCYKDGKGNVLVFAGRDGFLKIAQRDVRWNGMTSAYVCENDTFEMDVPGGKVMHTFGVTKRGAIIGAYCISKPKGCDFATVAWADINDYDKKLNAWSSNKGAMIMKVAETHCLKKAFGISGLQPEYDFEIQGANVVNINERPQIEAPTVEAIDPVKFQEAIDEIMHPDYDFRAIWHNNPELQKIPAYRKAYEKRIATEPTGTLFENQEGVDNV